MALISDIIIGLQILAQYVDENEHIGGAEHDVLYAVPPGTKVSDEHKRHLDELGWSYNEGDGWYHYC